MQEATELQEYSKNDGFKKKDEAQLVDGDIEDDNDSEDNDAFGIEDDEEDVKLEANDHKPLSDDVDDILVENNTKDEVKDEVISPLHTPDIPPSPVTAIPSPSLPKQLDNENNTNEKKEAVPTITTSPASPSSSSPALTINSQSSPSPSQPQSSSSSSNPLTSTSASPSPSPSPSLPPSSTLSPSLPTLSPSHSPAPASPSHPSKQLRTSTLLSNSTGSMTPETERKVMTYDERLKIYEDVLQSDILEIGLLRELAWQGVPEAKGLRAIYWKILLHYLPTNKALWEVSLGKSRKLYQDWVQELVIDPHAGSEAADHPLSQDRDSRWNAFFRDNEILGEIDKDVKRTFPHLHFFNQVSPTGEEIASPHYHVLKRILFIYAKLNPGIRYVQGMNELLGPIYYTFATDADPAFKEHAEADAFFCFTNLMSEVMDNFCKTLDKSEMGIVGNMKRLNLLFKEQDHELWEDLEEKKMNPQFYSFRWLTLLLSQEFELPDVLRLWDSLFADPDRFNFFYCFCCAMLICVRERLLNGSFADNLKLLQSYPPIDFQVIFATALKVHENTYEPPPPRNKNEPIPPATISPPPSYHASHASHSSNSSSSSVSSHSSSSHPPTQPSPTIASRLSFQNFFNKSSSSTPATKPTPPPATTNKPEKEKSTFTLPLGLGKFQI